MIEDDAKQDEGEELDDTKEDDTSADTPRRPRRIVRSRTTADGLPTLEPAPPRPAELAEAAAEAAKSAAAAVMTPAAKPSVLAEGARRRFDFRRERARDDGARRGPHGERGPSPEGAPAPRPRFEPRRAPERPRERDDAPRTPRVQLPAPPRVEAAPAPMAAPSKPLAPPKVAAAKAAPPAPVVEVVTESAGLESSNIGATLVGVPLPKAQSKVEKERPRTAKEALAAKTRAVAKPKPAPKRDTKRAGGDESDSEARSSEPAPKVAEAARSSAPRGRGGKKTEPVVEPSPEAAPAEKPGLLSRFFGLFKSKKG
jgi:hypothetical protein